MTCPNVTCIVTPRQNAVSPIAGNISKVTSCDGCQVVAEVPTLATRQATRVITMGQDPCVTNTPIVTPVLYSSTKTVSMSQAFIKNNCATGTGSTVIYTATADGTAYSTTSQLAADAQANQIAQSAAQQDIVSNGQAHANNNGACA